jgi:metal-sulfur cluster biosynthetic enzyme
MSTTAAMTMQDQVWDALAGVHDPELDEPITTLRFVIEVSVASGDTGAHVHVRLRLPTYFCAPNFAYLMVADAYDAVTELRGVGSATIELEDHFAAAEINDGVAAAAGFTGSFPGEATAELDDLRKAFQRKAYTAALERVFRRAVTDGVPAAEVAQMRLRDVPGGAERESLFRRRAVIGLADDDRAPLFVDDHGNAVAADDLPIFLRYARAVRVSIEGNAHFCRGLLATRYGEQNLAPIVSTTSGAGTIEENGALR